MEKNKELGLSDNQIFVDILEKRRLESDILWASREWNAASVYNYLNRNSPEKIKSIVLQSYRLQKIIQKIQKEKQVPPGELISTVTKILDGISYDRQESILRWLGFFVAKALKKLVLGVYVNEAKFLKIKSQMGSSPLLFVPSHKSYCDFILMSYICFHYDIDIPRIAAGMDFQSMAIVGTVLRDACAFFMRRSFTNDELYSAIFSQYVQTLVIYGDAAIEFFIEGTRSRTQKPLMPKYGFLSMALKPFFLGLVPDIAIVPVNLSYDRVLEEVLFAYELLGVPKPKESTKGLLKALSILNEKYGDIYAQFGDPISVKQYFSNKIDRSLHGFGSVEMQDLTLDESNCIIGLAHSIIRKQKDLVSISCFNLVAAVLNHHFSSEFKPLHVDNLLSEVQWFFEAFKNLAPSTAIGRFNSLTEDIVLDSLNLHKSLIHVSADKKVQVCRIHSTQANIDPQQLKGHQLSSNTMNIAIPLLILQIYVNPCAPFMVGVCFISLIVQSLSGTDSISIDKLLNEFEFLCSIFSFEFVLHSDFVHKDFEEAFNRSKNLGILKSAEENVFEMGNNIKLRLFCVNFLRSYIPGYITAMEVLLDSVGEALSEKKILKECQRRLELKLNNDSSLHPANLSLDLLTNAIQAMVSMKVLSKEKGKEGFQYKVNEGNLREIHSKLKKFEFSFNCKGNIMEQFCVFERSSL